MSGNNVSISWMILKLNSTHPIWRSAFQHLSGLIIRQSNHCNSLGRHADATEVLVMTVAYFATLMVENKASYGIRMYDSPFLISFGDSHRRDRSSKPITNKKWRDHGNFRSLLFLCLYHKVSPTDHATLIHNGPWCIYLAFPFVFVTILRMTDHPVEAILQYRFSNRDLLDEALLAAGASISDRNIQGNAQGNRRLALLGDSILRDAVLEPWYHSGESTGKII